MLRGAKSPTFELFLGFGYVLKYIKLRFFKYSGKNFLSEIK